MSCFKTKTKTKADGGAIGEEMQTFDIPVEAQRQLELEVLLAEVAEINNRVAITDQVELQISAREQIIRSTRLEIEALVENVTNTVKKYGEEIQVIKNTEGYLTYLEYREHKEREEEINLRIAELHHELGQVQRTASTIRTTRTTSTVNQPEQFPVVVEEIPDVAQVDGDQASHGENDTDCWNRGNGEDVGNGEVDGNRESDGKSEAENDAA
ncbi:Hypothetical protein D9617_31g063810 [Elsinoe fawcettii]|nr:Hypothetical protein D9617_31g063810 [Elsinoe fawcettii]